MLVSRGGEELGVFLFEFDTFNVLYHIEMRSYN